MILVSAAIGASFPFSLLIRPIVNSNNGKRTMCENGLQLVYRGIVLTDIWGNVVQSAG
jgi:hypothetical protein